MARTTTGGGSMRRTAATLVLAMVLVWAGAASAAERSVAPSRSIRVHAAVVRLAASVRVRELPRVGRAPVSGSTRIPLRRPSSSQASPPAGVPAGRSLDAGAPSTAVSAGSPLPGALGDADNGSLWGGANFTPPDMGFAVGGGKEIELVNLVGRVWSGSPPSPGSAFRLDRFFASSGDDLSDPWVLFDAPSGRFFAGIFDITLGGEVLAVSKTADPGGSWYVYRVRYPSAVVTNGGCPDQGKGGVDDSLIGLGFNVFSSPGCPLRSIFKGAAVEVFNKSEAMSGSTLHLNYTDPMPSRFSLVPAHALSPQSTLYLASLDPGSGNKLHLTTATGVPTGSAHATFSNLPDLSVPSYSSPPKALQRGTSTKIDSGDDRTQNVVYRSGRLVVAQSMGCVPSEDRATRACVRLYEVDTSTNQLISALTLGKSGTYALYPAASITSAGDVVVTLGASSSSMYPSLVGLAVPIGTSTVAYSIVASGTAPNTTGRYGDYFATAIDPANADTFWAAGEIGGISGTKYAWNTAVVPVAVT